MDTKKFVELTKKLAAEKKDDQAELERFKKFFERFHKLNRGYLDNETFEKAQGSLPSIAEAVADTVHYLDDEIARTRSKRLKLPVDNLTLNEMQKLQSRNEVFLREFLQELEKEMSHPHPST